jgi:ParB family chromosome partitioning protein
MSEIVKTEILPPVERPKKPALPAVWDYDKSVGQVGAWLYKWKNLTHEMLCELWVAREKLSKEGRPETGTKVPVKTWNGYCEEIGTSRQVANRWLHRYFETAHVSHNSGQNEWYTPKKYIDAARAVMGGIDLDPASSPRANQIVGATQYYTKDDDGLTMQWGGKVWMNPPYAQPLIGQFTEKLKYHVEAGDVQEAIVLINNATETEWFGALLDIFSAVCFPEGRIKFIDEQGRPSGAPLQGQAIIYIGVNRAQFIKEFKGFGECLLSAE